MYRQDIKERYAQTRYKRRKWIEKERDKRKKQILKERNGQKKKEIKERYRF